MSEIVQDAYGHPAQPAVYETRYRPDGDDSIAFCVVDAVATAAEVSPLDIDEQLYHAIDPEALERVFQSNGLGARCSVSFEFAGYQVVTCSSGEVSVYEN
jgi:hypothetical protein